jgi:hypothetical protein
LTVTPSGHLSSALTICSEAFVDGRVTGTLVCETTLTLVVRQGVIERPRDEALPLAVGFALLGQRPCRAGLVRGHGRFRKGRPGSYLVWFAR